MANCKKGFLYEKHRVGYKAQPGAQKQILPGFEVPENSACETHGFGMNPPGARQAPKNGSMLRLIPFAEAFEQGVAGPMNFDKRALQEVSCYWGHMLG